MTFLIRPGVPLHAAQLQARALAMWRDPELRSTHSDLAAAA